MKYLETSTNNSIITFQDLTITIMIVIILVVIMMMMLLYHRRLKMSSEALELRVEDGRDSHCWCMCVVSDGYGRLGGGCDGGGGWFACRTKTKGLLECRQMIPRFPTCEVKTLMTPDHTAVQIRSSW